MQQPQAKLKQIQRIFALWPSQAGDDGEELLRGYLLAVEDYPADDVERGVDMLVKGTAPGVSPSYRPKPPEVGAECRRQMMLRLDSEARERAFRPALPPPGIEHSAADRAKVAEHVKRAVKALSVAPEEDPIERHRRIIARTNERFDAERGNTVGDDGEEAA
jgi:hypothetical protein